MNNSKKSIFEVYEYKRDGIIIHAHPNYNSFGEWYDWVMMDFAAPDDDQDFVGNVEGL